jgi:hypothetical protein
MANTMKDTIKEPIQIVDQPEETSEGKGLNIWLLIPVVLAVAGAIFFVVSRILSKEE